MVKLYFNILKEVFGKIIVNRAKLFNFSIGKVSYKCAPLINLLLSSSSGVLMMSLFKRPSLEGKDAISLIARCYFRFEIQ